MDTYIKMQPAAVNADAPEVDAEHAAQNAPKPAWHAPVITRIDIKRTKSGKGSINDGTVNASLVEGVDFG
ncbi:hypothetical protein D4R89_13895 [bacterium]|nr:MAG: hypothetical protein D4R89_13895 [bacterium]